MEHFLMMAVVGSHLYGTNDAHSDIDYRGVCYEPLPALLGLHNFEQEIITDPDQTVYGLKKFMRLSLDNNPNIVEMWFANYTIQTEAWKTLWNVRQEILSQKVRKTYAGYAQSQLHRVKNHRRWLEKEPQPGDNDCAKYKEWRDNRNPKRYALEVHHGYDTKHAAHLFRLLLQGKQILLEHDLNPRLCGEDLEFIYNIKYGVYAYDKMLRLADEMFEDFAQTPSTLREKPDVSLFERRTMKLLYSHIVNTYTLV